MRSGLPGTTIVEFLKDAPSRVLQAGGSLMMIGLLMVFFIGGAEIPGTPGLVFRVIGISGGVLMLSGAGLMVWHINRLERLEKKERGR